MEARNFDLPASILHWFAFMPRPSLQAVLLVDGYNVVGAWLDLRQKRDLEGLESARRGLIEILANYSASQGFDTRIVFDSQYRETPGDCETITRNLSVHYTNFGQTADSYIEKACSLFRYDVRKFHQRLIVATSDRAEQLTVVGYGAEWMSAQKLAQEVEAASSRVKQRQRQQRRSPNRLLGNSLDPVAQERLTQLRFGQLNSRKTSN